MEEQEEGDAPRRPEPLRHDAKHKHEILKHCKHHPNAIQCIAHTHTRHTDREIIASVCCLSVCLCVILVLPMSATTIIMKWIPLLREVVLHGRNRCIFTNTPNTRHGRTARLRTLLHARTSCRRPILSSSWLQGPRRCCAAAERAFFALLCSSCQLRAQRRSCGKRNRRTVKNGWIQKEVVVPPCTETIAISKLSNLEDWAGRTMAVDGKLMEISLDETVSRWWRLVATPVDTHHQEEHHTHPEKGPPHVSKLHVVTGKGRRGRGGWRREALFHQDYIALNVRLQKCLVRGM